MRLRSVSDLCRLASVVLVAIALLVGPVGSANAQTSPSNADLAAMVFSPLDSRGDWFLANASEFQDSRDGAYLDNMLQLAELRGSPEEDIRDILTANDWQRMYALRAVYPSERNERVWDFSITSYVFEFPDDDSAHRAFVLLEDEQPGSAGVDVLDEPPIGPGALGDEFEMTRYGVSKEEDPLYGRTLVYSFRVGRFLAGIQRTDFGDFEAMGSAVTAIAMRMERKIQHFSTLDAPPISDRALRVGNWALASASSDQYAMLDGVVVPLSWSDDTWLIGQTLGHSTDVYLVGRDWSYAPDKTQYLLSLYEFESEAESEAWFRDYNILLRQDGISVVTEAEAVGDDSRLYSIKDTTHSIAAYEVVARSGRYAFSIWFAGAGLTSPELVTKMAGSQVVCLTHDRCQNHVPLPELEP